MSHQQWPKVSFQNIVDSPSTDLMLAMTNVKKKCVVRFTGGCGNMSSSDAKGLNDLFVTAFHGYRGSLLFGGTRMLKLCDHDEVVPSITEVPPLIRGVCPKAWLVGIVPKTGGFNSDPNHGITVDLEPCNGYITMVHPNQDECLLIQRSVDAPADWDDEWRFCHRLMAPLRNSAGFSSLTIAYNGGGVTQREIIATAELGWPVLLIHGSGRTTDALAADHEFLSSHPNVVCADANAKSVRRVLEELKVV